MNTDKKKYNETLLHITLLVAGILFAYFKIFQAGYIAWDDNEYVVQNSDIRQLGLENIALWFSKIYIGNYHPLTMFSYAIDYAIGGLQPLTYHVTNLLLHTCNAILLYIFIDRLQPNKIIGLFVALLFALNPVQTESVSWIAERKTILCAFFYLLALLQYTSYAVPPSGKRLAAVMLWGLAAILSKGIGVALPLSMLATDIWMRRDLTKGKPWLEKIPFFVVSLVLGIVAIRAQAADKFLDMRPGGHSWTDTIMFAAYGYVQYIIHFIAPVRLSVMYPYPPDIGPMQLLFSIVAMGVIALTIISYRKKWNVLLGGIVFFTANIILMLQFIRFGDALMADRYLYIAGMGILFPLVYYPANWLMQAKKPPMPITIGATVSIVFAITTFLRNDIWLSDLNFYTAILHTFPESAMPNYSLGALYTKMGDYRTAEGYINTAVSLEPGNYKAWYDKGVLYRHEGNDVVALDALNRCIALAKYPKAYFSRALLYESTGQPDLALADIETVLAGQPHYARAWYVKADCLEQKNDIPGAIENFTKAISCDASDPLFFIRRGLAYGKSNQLQPALSDLNNAVSINPGNGEALYYRGIIKYKAGQDACNDFRNALAHGFRQAQQALSQFCK